MKKKVFWIGEIALVVGVALFYYDFSTIQNIYAIHTELKQRWDLAQLLQPIGLGLLALGAIMLAYGVFVKK